MSKKDKEKITILVCNGDKCQENKSKKLRERLKELIEEKGMIDHIDIKKTGCMGHCKKAPVVQIEPGNIELTQIKPKDAEDILAKALKQLKK